MNVTFRRRALNQESSLKSFISMLTIVWCLLSPPLGVAQEVVSSSAVSRFARRDTDAIPDFQKHVVPLLGRLGCNSAKCHGSFQGQAGFRLSLFGFDFQADHSAIGAEASSMQEHRIRIDDPEESLIILKPTEQTDHAGGRRFELNSWEHHLLLRWIESGAIGSESRNTDPSPQVNQTKFSPEGIDLFNKKIQPLLENHCYECHGFNNRKGGLQVKTRDMLLQGGSSGSAIVPGNPEESLLIQAVRYSSDALQMPPSGKLPKSVIADFETWIRQGAPDPRTEVIKARRDLHTVAVEPSASPVISGGDPGPHKIQGIGAGFIPGNLNTEIVDEVVQVSNEDAFETAQQLCLLEGFPAGISSGATIWAALQVAKREEMAGKRVVVIAASATERYLSTPLAESVREEVANLPVSEI